MNDWRIKSKNVPGLMLMAKEVMGALVQSPQLPTLLRASIFPAKLNCNSTSKKIYKILLSRHICTNRVSITVKRSNSASVKKKTQGFRDIQIGERQQRPQAAERYTNRRVFFQLTHI